MYKKLKDYKKFKKYFKITKLKQFIEIRNIEIYFLRDI